MVTHGVSHLHKCDDIMVVSQGEIVDHGSYNDLMIRSKILRDFVHSIATSDSEQYQRRASVPATPSELISSPFEIAEDDVHQDGSQPISIEVAEETKKIIQKEIVQTGSVSYLLQYCLFLNDTMVKF